VTAPANSIASEQTAAKTGRWRKNWITGLGHATRDYILLGKSAPAFAHIAADLRRKDDAVAFAVTGKPPADDRFRLAVDAVVSPSRIVVGGVDQIKFGVDECIKKGKRGRFVRCPSEHVPPEC
jgi:hypothetical protein